MNYFIFMNMLYTLVAISFFIIAISSVIAASNIKRMKMYLWEIYKRGTG